MCKTLIAGIVAVGFAAAMALAAAPAFADPYKWCAVYSDNDGGGGSNCGFATIEQCRATVGGMGGFCELNPFYTGPIEKPVKRERKRQRG